MDLLHLDDESIWNFFGPHQTSKNKSRKDDLCKLTYFSEYYIFQQ